MNEEVNDRVNAGYTIIDSIHIKQKEFVLAQNPNASSEYVTWECVNGKDYYYGHYYSDKFKAQKDLIRRAESAVKALEHFKITSERGER